MSTETQALSSHSFQSPSGSSSSPTAALENGFSERNSATSTSSTAIINGISQLKKQGEKILADHVPTTEALGKYIKSIHESINTPLVPSTNYWLMGYRVLEKLGSPLAAAWNHCTTPAAKSLMLLAVGVMFWLPLLLFFWLMLVPSVFFLTFAYIILFGKQNLQLHVEETFTYATGLTVKEGVSVVEDATKTFLMFMSHTVDQMPFIKPEVIKGQMYDFASATIAIMLSILDSFEKFLHYLNVGLNTNCKPKSCSKKVK